MCMFCRMHVLAHGLLAESEELSHNEFLFQSNFDFNNINWISPLSNRTTHFPAHVSLVFHIHGEQKVELMGSHSEGQDSKWCLCRE